MIDAAPKRFNEKIMPIPEGRGCWIWLANCNHGGYGSFRLKGKLCRAHRVAYEFVHGHIPDGMYLDHLCRVRCCVNPAHLEIVTFAENIRRGINANRLKTHCINGHSYSGKNLYVNPNNGERSCRICSATKSQKYQDKIKNLTKVEKLAYVVEPRELKTHCSNGHQLSGNNLYTRPSKKNSQFSHRECLACKKKNKERFDVKKKLERQTINAVAAQDGKVFT